MWKKVHSALIDFCRENDKVLDEGHGLVHFISVFNHAKRAIQEHEFLDEIYIAALLHDVDDSKFFNNTDNSTNLMKLCGIPNESIKLVKEMIDLVSCSKNGCSDNVDSWKLIPRDCDRLEAIGNGGLLRALQYNNHIKRDFMGNNTYPKTREELMSNLSQERFNNYKGKSESYMDHLYDKVLYIGLAENLKSNNEYIHNKAKELQEQMIDTILKLEEIKDLERYLKQNL